MIASRLIYPKRIEPRYEIRERHSGAPFRMQIWVFSFFFMTDNLLGLSVTPAG